MAKDIQIVGFRVGHEDFGITIASVHEVVRMMDITQVPDSPIYIEGVINLRGRIIPVIDLRKRFHETEIQRNKKNRIMVTEVSGHQVGLVVDTASEVLRIPSDQIEPPPNVFGENDINYVTGVGKMGNRLIILVNLDKIMQHGELKSLESVLGESGAA